MRYCFDDGTSLGDSGGGDVTQDTKFRNLNYFYDANGRMYKTSKTAASTQSNAVYHAAGQRVAAQIDGVWTFFLYDAGGKMVSKSGGLQSTDEAGVKYLLSDWQGSTRAELTNTGIVNARADYTAFGEEIGAGAGQRTTSQRFSAANTNRQKYGLTERDEATGRDHTWFRKHENRAGTWTSPDPYGGSMMTGDPQSFNRYSNVQHDPINFIDPSGLLVAVYVCEHSSVRVCDDNGGNCGPWEEGPPVNCHWELINIGGAPTGGGGFGDPSGGGSGEGLPLLDNCRHSPLLKLESRGPRFPNSCPARNLTQINRQAH
jgi:RHS repeat-associated protein